MQQISTLRLFLLRGMYLLIAVGLGLNIWPSILQPATRSADPDSVVQALLGGLSLLCVLGLRYPTKMLPLLLFELLWKVIWVVSVLPLWLAGTLDSYGQETFFACMFGVILIPIVIPWGYVYRAYGRSPGDPFITS